MISSNDKLRIRKAVDVVNKRYGKRVVAYKDVLNIAQTETDVDRIVGALETSTADYNGYGTQAYPSVYNNLIQAQIDIINDQRQSRRMELRATGVFDPTTPKGRLALESAKTSGDYSIGGYVKTFRQPSSKTQMMRQFKANIAEIQRDPDELYYKNFISSMENAGFGSYVFAIEQAFLESNMTYRDFFVFTMANGASKYFDPQRWYEMRKSIDNDPRVASEIFGEVFTFAQTMLVVGDPNMTDEELELKMKKIGQSF